MRLRRMKIVERIQDREKNKQGGSDSYSCAHQNQEKADRLWGISREQVGWELVFAHKY